MQRSVCHPLHMYTHFTHIYSEALKCPTLLIPYQKSLAALYLRDTTDWKCVRMCETQSPEHSLFSMSVTKSGCLLNPLRHRHIHIQPPYSHQQPKSHFHHLSKLQDGKTMKRHIQCFKKFSFFFFKCSLSRTVSSLVSPVLLLSWIQEPAAIY